MTKVEEKFGALLRQYGRGALSILVLVLVVHDIFGTHGFLAMHRTRAEIEKVQKDLDRLNKENLQLADEVQALKSDPRLIEKIAREDFFLAKPGEIIIKLRQHGPEEQSQAIRP